MFGDISRRRRIVAERTGSQVRSGRHQIATVHVSRPGETSAEVAARVSTGARSRAIAARLEFHRDRWLCTALHFG